MTTCECGCGGTPRPGKRFLHGHWSRSRENREMRETMRKPVEPPNPTGICQCGCGEPAPIANRNRPSRGEVAGQPQRFIHGHHNRLMKGENTSGWKGGRWEHKQGYVYLYLPQHPDATQDGYILEHRLIAERTLGRRLKNNEDVHHINGIKNDNRPENIVVLTKSDHHRLHFTETLGRYYAEQWAKDEIAAGRDPDRVRSQDS